MKIYIPDEHGYAVSHTGTVFIRLNRGVIRGTGADGLDLLHRLSTNAVVDLKEGEEAITIFTSDKGRVVEVPRIIPVADHVLILLLGRDVETVRSWLDKYTIMDDFETADVTGEYGAIGLYGDHARGIVEAVAGSVPEAGKVALFEIAGGKGVAFRDTRLSGIGSFVLLAQTAALVALANAFTDAGATEINEETYETLRIEAGLPAPERELTEKYNPLEAGLMQYISFTKGCYIGQEVIARLDTYDKVQRHLVGITFDTLAADAVTAQDVLNVREPVEDTLVGIVTSLAYSPGLKAHIALAYLRTQHAVPGLPVIVTSAEDTKRELGRGAIVKLPFPV